MGRAGLRLRAAAVRPPVLDLLGGTGNADDRELHRSERVAPRVGRTVSAGVRAPERVRTLDALRQSKDNPWEGAFDATQLCSPQSLAGGYPNNLGFGNLERNVLRGLWQRRVDLGLSKTFTKGRTNFEVRWDIFNLLNTVNFALPNNVIGDPGTDFGLITDTIGGPRVMQVAMKVRF